MPRRHSNELVIDDLASERDSKAISDSSSELAFHEQWIIFTAL
jgi:hypothetical protein